ncbi:MAG: hypothetical protein ACJ8AG_10060 [Ktedonobacteraceae bacterium]
MMTTFRQKLLASPARYHCAVCGGRTVEFHLCWYCLQTVHPGCICHPLTRQPGNGTSSFRANREGLPSYEKEVL